MKKWLRKGGKERAEGGKDERNIFTMGAHESEIKNSLIITQARATPQQSISLTHFCIPST